MFMGDSVIFILVKFQFIERDDTKLEKYSSPIKIVPFNTLKIKYITLFLLEINILNTYNS